VARELTEIGYSVWFCLVYGAIDVPRRWTGLSDYFIGLHGGSIKSISQTVYVIYISCIIIAY